MIRYDPEPYPSTTVKFMEEANQGKLGEHLLFLPPGPNETQGATNARNEINYKLLHARKELERADQQGEVYRPDHHVFLALKIKQRSKTYFGDEESDSCSEEDNESIDKTPPPTHPTQNMTTAERTPLLALNASPHHEKPEESLSHYINKFWRDFELE